MKQFIKSFLLRVLIVLIGIIGTAISLFTLPIGIIVRCIISWIVAPIVWVIFGNHAYDYLIENIGISAFIDKIGSAHIFDDGFPIECWYLNAIAKLKKYYYYHYDKDYLKHIEFEKKEKERKEQYEKDIINYRKFIEQKRKEILMKMFPYANIDDIDPGYLEILELNGTLPKLPF